MAEYKEVIRDAVNIIKPNECAFVHPTDVTAATDIDFDVIPLKPDPVFGAFSGDGNLNKGLTLEYYTGPNFKKALDIPWALMGFTMYVQVSWNPIVLKDKMGFFVKECKIIELNEKKEAIYGINILDQTCFAQVVQAEPIGKALESKVVSFDSQFKYRSFSFNRKQSGYQVLQCQVEFCILTNGVR